MNGIVKGKRCPRCRGQIVVDLVSGVLRFTCLQCGWYREGKDWGQNRERGRSPSIPGVGGSM